MMNVKRITKALATVFSANNDIEKVAIKCDNGNIITIGINTEIIEVFGGYGERNSKKTQYIEIDNNNNDIAIWSKNGELLNFYDKTEQYNSNEIIAILTYSIMNNKNRIENRIDFWKSILFNSWSKENRGMKKC